MELNKLYNMDCLIGMQEIPSGSVDLIICDTPYGTIKGIGKSTDNFNKDTTWDVVIPTDRLFDKYERVLRRGRNWIGYEMNKEFYNRALKRIDETMRTPTLF